MQKIEISNELKEILFNAGIEGYDANLKKLNLPSIRLSVKNIEEICRLYPNLEELDINTTELKDDGCKYVGQLKNLTWLDVSGNDEIGKIGIHELCNLTKLEWLDISLAQLTDECVDDLLKLENIKSMLLSATQITVHRLGELKKLKHLEKLDLIRSDAGNVLPWNLVCAKNAKKILDFVTVDNDSKAPLGNYRLLLLGEPGSGKTAIFSKLTKGFKKPTSTLGVNIKPIDEEMAGEELKDVHCNIWDFGGQDYQIPIHEIFLSDNCIFTIVIEPRMNDVEKNFKKWYDVIKRHTHIYINGSGVNSFPVIVLFSKLDDANGGLGYLVNGESDRERVKNEIRNIIKKDIKNRKIHEGVINDNDLNIKFVDSSAVINGGLDEFKKVIKKELDDASRGNNYNLNVSDEVSKLDKLIMDRVNDDLYLTLDVAESLYNKIDSNPKNLSLEECLSQLNEYGDILYDEGNNYIFANPDKFARIVYEILLSNTYNEVYCKLKKDGILYNNINIINSDIARKIFESEEYIKELGSKEICNNEVLSCILDRMAHHLLLVPIERNKYMIPNRSPYADYDLLYKILKQNDSASEYSMWGARHFVVELEEYSKSILFKILSHISRNIISDGFTIRVEPYLNFFVLKTRINGIKEMGIIFRDVDSESIDFYISAGEAETGLISYFVDALEHLERDLYSLYAVCPCMGRLEGECNIRYDYKKLLEIKKTNNRFRFNCLESGAVLTPDSFLKSSIIDLAEHRTINDETENQNIFVIMPFGNLDDKNNPYTQINNDIKDVCSILNRYLIKRNIQISSVRADEIRMMDIIDNKILNAIKEASVIITIFMDYKPNCFFEFGMAKTYKKDFFTYVPNDEVPPFDIAHIDRCKVDFKTPGAFKKRLLNDLAAHYNVVLENN